MPNARKKVMRKPYKKYNNKSANSDTKLSTKFGSGKPYNVKPEPFPRVLITRAKYLNNELLTLGTANYTFATGYAINDIYNPLFGGTGTSVVGHSMLASLYSNYLVYGCKVQVSFYNPNEDGIVCGVRMRVGSGGATLSQNLVNLLEQPLTYSSALANSGSQKKSFQFYIKPWTLLGISKLEFMANVTGYSTQMTTVPTSPAYIDVFAIQPVGTTSTIRYTIKMMFYIKCFNRKYLTTTA